MAITIPQGYIVRSPEAIDNRLVLTKDQMKFLSRSNQEGQLPPAYIALCAEKESDGKHKLYIYDRNNEFNDITGKYEVLSVFYNDILNKPIVGNGIDPNAYDKLPVPELTVLLDNETLVFDSETGAVQLSDDLLDRIEKINEAILTEVERATSEEGRLQAEIDTKQDHLIAGDAIEINQIIPGEANIYVKIDDSTIHYNSSEGYLELHPDPSRSFHVSEGTLYVDVDGNTVRHNNGKLEAKKVLAGNAIRLNDSEGGDVRVNVVIDGDTIHFDSENGQTYLALHLSSERGIQTDNAGEIYVKIDNATLVYNSEGELKLPLDYTTVIINSEGKIRNNIDNNTLIYSTSERVVRVEVQHLVLLGNNADFDSERYWRIRHDSELRARTDDIEDHLFFLDSQGNIITITSSELSGPGPGEVVWNIYQDQIDRLEEWDKSHYVDPDTNAIIPANWPNYSGVYGVQGVAGVNPSNKQKLSHVSTVDRDKWNRVVGKQNKLILEDTTNNTHYKNALLLYANGSHDTPLACATSEISLRVDNDSICIREPSEGGYLELYADGYIHRPPHTADLLVVTDSEGQPYWTSADRFGKIDSIDITDGTRTKTLPVVNKKVAIPVTDGLILKSGTSEIAHANAVTPQTRAANHVLIPVGTDAQGHIIDGTTATVANGLRELTFYDRSNNAGAYVTTSQPWAIITDPTNVTNTTNVSLKVAGFDGNAAVGHKYDNATLKVDANGLSGNYQIVPQKTGKRTTSEGLLEIINNKVNFLPSFLNRLVLNDYAKNAIDSEGLRDDHYYPTITLLKTELDAKQDFLHPIFPAVITSEGDSEGPNKLYVLYDNDSIKLNNNGELVTKDVYLATLPGIPLSDIVPTDANSENQMTTEGWVQDSISSNLGRFVGNFTSEGALPDKGEVPTLARNDYAFVTVPVYDSEGNVEYLYYRYKYVDDTSETGHWQFEYQVSGSTFTYKQLLALNSDWNLQLTNTAKAHFNNADIHITAVERTKWNNKQDKLTAGDHINATSLAANTVKVDAQTSISDATTYDSKLSTIGAIKGYFKKKQNAIAANTGTIDTSATYVVASIAQNEQGVITPTRVAFDYDKLSSRPTINGSTITGALLANDGITYNTATKAIKHSNSVTADTTSGLKYFTYDAQGHVTASVNKTLSRGINDQSNVIGHSNSVTPATNVGQTANKIPYFSYDAQGHITGSNTKDQYPAMGTTDAGKVLAVNAAGTGVYWLTLPEGTSYTPGTGLALSGAVFNHSNSVTAASNVGGFGTNSALIPSVSYDAQGHFTATATRTLTGTAGIKITSTAGATTGTVGHTNSVTAASNVGGWGTAGSADNNNGFNITKTSYDAQGHITVKTPEGVTGAKGIRVNAFTKKIEHTNAVTGGAKTDFSKTGIKVPYFSYDAQGHFTATGEKDIFPSLSGNAKKVLAVNSEGTQLEWAAVSGGTNADWPKSVTNRTQTANWDPDVIKTVPFIKQGDDSNKTGVILGTDSNTASGQYSLAGGTGSTASGNRSVAIGQIVEASGENSIAFGNRTVSSSNDSVATGFKTTASGAYAVSMGYQNTASNIASAAFGQGNISSGYASFATGRSATASGDDSFAAGSYASATGAQSHAEGQYTIASGEGSHVEGVGFAAGSYTEASGKASHAEGRATKASAFASHAEGSDSIASGSSSHAEGSVTKAYGVASHTEGSITYTSEGSAYAHAEGYYTKAIGAASHAEGGYGVQGTNRYYTEAIGKASHAEGMHTIASGDYSHAEGQGNFGPAAVVASGVASHAEGKTTTASGEASHAEGSYSAANGYYSHAEGYHTTAASMATHAEGYYTSANLSYQHVQGQYNVVDSSKYADIVGWGTSDTARKNISSLTKAGDLHIKQDFYFQSDDDGQNGYKLPYNVITEAGNGAKTLALAKRDHVYIYTGALTSLTVTAIEKTDAITDIIFTAGASITVTLPTGVRLPSGFSGFEANKTYEINILYNLAIITAWE